MLGSKSLKKPLQTLRNVNNAPNRFGSLASFEENLTVLRTMKTKNALGKLALAIAVSSLLAVNASAIVTYDFTYSDTSGNVANGQLSGTDL